MASSIQRRFADLLAGSQRIAVLTGAGISTSSGIPDFRSSAGLYARPDLTGIFDLEAFRRDPAGFYLFAQTFYPLVKEAQPNLAHRVLADWERTGKNVQIATQNIDDLHQRAGSKRVHAVHGDLRTSTCIDCGHSCETHTLEPDVQTGVVPRCSCGGVFKPDIVFFGEMLPESVWQAAEEAMRRADLVLVLGSSLAVHPASGLPWLRPRTAKLVVVNRDPTPLDDEADVVLHDDLVTVFAAVA